MCHSWVRHIIRRDPEKRIKFAPLEGKTAEEILKPIFPDYLKEDTVVYYDNGHIYIRSNAALQIFQALGYNFRWFSRFIPKNLLDKVYNWIAARRYKYGNRYNSCPLPPMEWRDRFMN